MLNHQPGERLQITTFTTQVPHGIFLPLEAGIANAISSFKWQKKILS